MNTIAADGTIYDEHGNVVGKLDPRTIPNLHGPRLGSLGAGYLPWGSIGGDIWEYFHPDTVQREYQAVGKDAPTIDEIQAGAAGDISENIQQGIRDAADSAMSAGKWFIVGLGILALLELMKHLPRARR